MNLPHPQRPIGDEFNFLNIIDLRVEPKIGDHSAPCYGCWFYDNAEWDCVFVESITGPCEKNIFKKK